MGAAGAATALDGSIVDQKSWGRRPRKPSTVFDLEAENLQIMPVRVVPCRGVAASVLALAGLLVPGVPARIDDVTPDDERAGEGEHRGQGKHDRIAGAVRDDAPPPLARPR